MPLCSPLTLGSFDSVWNSPPQPRSASSSAGPLLALAGTARIALFLSANSTAILQLPSLFDQPPSLSVHTFIRKLCDHERTCPTSPSSFLRRESASLRDPFPSHPIATRGSGRSSESVNLGASSVNRE